MTTESARRRSHERLTELFLEALFRMDMPFHSQVRQEHYAHNVEKLNTQARQNLPLSTQSMLFPLPDKHLANVSLDRIHTTRRAQVLAQDVAEPAAEKPEKRRAVEGLTKPEKVFQRTNPRPIETTTTFPESLINSDNS